VYLAVVAEGSGVVGILTPLRRALLCLKSLSTQTVGRQLVTVACCVTTLRACSSYYHTCCQLPWSARAWSVRATRRVTSGNARDHERRNAHKLQAWMVHAAAVRARHSDTVRHSSGVAVQN